MKAYLITIIICIMTSLASCGQKSSLNEKWSFKESRNLSGNPNLIYESGNGIDCYFYENNTFEIYLWIYGESIGRQQAIVKGKYQYNSSTKEIVLIETLHKESNMFQESTPVSYYVVKGFEQGGISLLKDIHNKHFPDFSKIYLKIATETKDNIQVDLYVYNANGEKVSFGQRVYIRETLDKNNN